MNNNAIVKEEKIKKPTDYKGFKIAIGCLIAIVVALIATFIALGIFNSVINNISEQKASGIMANITLNAMPESIQSPDGRYVFYCEKNENFDPSTDNMADFVSFYYLDESDNKVYVDNGVIKNNDGEEVSIALGFMFKTVENLNATKGKISSALVVIGILAFGLIIWASYYVYAYNEDKKALVKTKDRFDKNVIAKK